MEDLDREVDGGEEEWPVETAPVAIPQEETEEGKPTFDDDIMYSLGRRVRRRGEEGGIPWREIEMLLVHGVKGPDGSRKFLTLSAIARRCVVSQTTVKNFAVDLKCFERRHKLYGEPKPVSRRFNNDIPYQKIEKLLVYGEEVDGEVRYPGFAELAKRFQCSPASVYSFAKRAQCRERRKKLAAEDAGIGEPRDLGDLVDEPPLLSLYPDEGAAPELELPPPPEVSERDRAGNGGGMVGPETMVKARVVDLYTNGIASVDKLTRRLLKSWPTPWEIGEIVGLPEARIRQLVHGDEYERAREQSQTEFFEQSRLEQAAMVKMAVETQLWQYLAVIDELVKQFRERVMAREVPLNTVADFDRLLRLRSFLLGEADSRVEVTGAVTLTAVQSRFQTLSRERLEVDDAMFGVVENAEVDAELLEAEKEREEEEADPAG